MSLELPPISEEQFTQDVVRKLMNHENLSLDSVWQDVKKFKLDEQKIVILFVQMGIIEPRKEPEINETDFLKSLYED